MAKTILALPQTEIEVDGTTYLVDAMPATIALEVQDELMEASGKPTIKLVKRVICGSVTLNGSLIDTKSFDMVFARKTMHLYQLFDKIIQWNFDDVFTSGTEEQE